MRDKEMSKEIGQRITSRRFRKGQWKYVVKLTLLLQEEQSLLFGGDLIRDGGDLIHDGDDLSTNGNF